MYSLLRRHSFVLVHNVGRWLLMLMTILLTCRMSVSDSNNVLDGCHLWNAALCKPTAMNSVFQHGSSDLAVDGNRNVNFNEGSCAHTDHEESVEDHWWLVDLEDEYMVHRIVVTNRVDGGDNRFHLVSIDMYVTDPRLDNAFPHNTDGVQCVYVPESFEGTKSFDCITPTYARYIKLLRTFKWYFNFCEVEVMVSRKRGDSECRKLVSASYEIVKDSSVANGVTVATTVTSTAGGCVLLCVGKGDLCNGCAWREDTGRCQTMTFDIYNVARHKFLRGDTDTLFMRWPVNIMKVE